MSEHPRPSDPESHAQEPWYADARYQGNKTRRLRRQTGTIAVHKPPATTPTTTGDTLHPSSSVTRGSEEAHTGAVPNPRTTHSTQRHVGPRVRHPTSGAGDVSRVMRKRLKAQKIEGKRSIVACIDEFLQHGRSSYQGAEIPRSSS
eukprot:TRINITY_DN84590_c0_g1_i1.p1 TRINITY_DN84590_c0_g1~~TRINITY_DN84590_c0_g1_i1.p1  ORF type:complete len:170 (+),score=3.84 TRINITY_DN84590_c0_g1_i1:73-510(+)